MHKKRKPDKRKIRARSLTRKKDYFCGKSHRDWVKLLLPYWRKRRKIEQLFHKIERNIEQDMSVRARMALEFFYCDGDCVGIGAEDWDVRKQFPLLHDLELEEK